MSGYPVTLGEIAVVGGPVYFDPGHYHGGMTDAEYRHYAYAQYSNAFLYAAAGHQASKFYSIPSSPTASSFQVTTPFSTDRSQSNRVTDISFQKDDLGNLYYSLSTGKEPADLNDLVTRSGLQIDVHSTSFHHYEVKTTICYTSNPNCTPLNVYHALKQKPAPWVYNENGVKNDEVSYVTGLGPVRHVVDASNLSVSNVTLGNHELYPGIVFQQVYKDGVEIGVRTIGIGTGMFGWANEKFSPVVWGHNGLMIKTIFENNQADVFKHPLDFGFLAKPVDNYASVNSLQMNNSIIPDNFDPYNYLASNDGLSARIGSRDGVVATQHYIDHGRHLNYSTTSFHGLEYIASHRDLMLAYGAHGRGGAFHYIDWGRTEGRSTTFDGLRYIASWGDLINAYGADINAGAVHYIKWGYDEGWRSTNFDPIRYGNLNGDVRSAYNNDPDLMTIHYIKYGFNEGRDTGAGQPRMAPVLIDLDGDGVEIDTIGVSNASFDYHGTGQKLPSAWAGKDDGILVIDLNNDGRYGPDNKIDQLFELSFSASHAKINSLQPHQQLSDLEALELMYDTNKNGLLDTLDDSWDSFRIWSDINQDGIFADGELLKLEELGIESIKLSASVENILLADGTVITGLSHAETASGKKYEIADVQLAYGTISGKGTVTQDQIDDVVSIGSKIGFDVLL